MTFAALALAFASWSASTPPSPPLPAPASPPLVVDVSAVVRPTARALEAAAVEAGRKTYQMRCQGCHGATGAGDGPVGRALRPAPQKFSDALWQARVTDDEMKKAIQLGGAAVGKAPTMPPAKDLSVDAIASLVAFVRSLRAPHGTASVTVMLPDGRDVTASADADATGAARVTVAGVSGKVTVVGVVDPSGAPVCTVDVAEAAGATVRCAPKGR
jgi:mono/diheme cytochrome c family protein